MEQVNIIDALNGMVIGATTKKCVEGWLRYNNLTGYFTDSHTLMVRPWHIRNYNADLNGIDIQSLRPVAGVKIFFERG